MNRTQIFEMLPDPIYRGIDRAEIIDRLKALYTHALEDAEQTDSPGMCIEDMQALAAAIDVISEKL